ncbi:MAG: hypothetical protein IKB02_04855 [Clostridia bacterium]|nr:hypothetical protein [Clostridia bacterium]
MWNDVNKILPEKDGDYLVYIRNAEAPCVLSFHADVAVWYDEIEGEFYNVTHWLPIPSNPKATFERLFDDGGVLKSKIEFAIYFSLDEVITYRENLRFMLSYCDLPPYLSGKLGHLLSNFENVLGDKK